MGKDVAQNCLSSFSKRKS